jgi:hypothetical protein
MSRNNPMLLACGHIVTGFFDLRFGGGRPSQVRCPEGCGWQIYVTAPDLDLDELSEDPR